MQRSRRRISAAWLGATVLICLLGEIAVMRLLPSLTVQPGFEFPPAAWFNNEVALRLPVRIVVVHIARSLPILAIVIATVVLAGWTGSRFAASLDGLRRRGIALVSAQLFVGCVLALFPVTFSSDAHAYMLLGHLYGLHGINPYANRHLIVQPGSDATLGQLSSLFGQPLPFGDEYGPLFTLWVGAVSHVFGSSIAVEYAVQRIAAVVAAAGTSLALLRLLRTKADVVRRVGTFAFHPLVLCETAINGHNDMFMVAFAAGAFAVADEAPIIAGLLFGASVAIKIVSIVVFPFFVAIAMRRSPMRGLIAAALAAVVVVLSFRPFWVGWHTIGGLTKGSQYFFSPTYLINTVLFGSHFDDRLTSAAFPALHAVPVLRHATWPQIVTFFIIVLFVVGAVTLFVRFVRRRSVEDLFATMVAFVWSTPIFNPWYFVWLSPIVAWSGFWSRYVWSALWIALLYYPLHYGYENGVLYGPSGIAITVATYFVPLLFAWVGHRRARRQSPPILDAKMVSDV